MPEIHGDIELEHRHRYLAACELAVGKRILDIASGEGYGSAMLAARATHVVGVDLSAEAVAHASRTYPLANLEFRQGSAAEIPLEAHSVDGVVSFETIEHLDQHEKMMAEIKRVLRPGGFLIISSPDKHWSSDVPQRSNPFHVKELRREEFAALLARHFAHVVMASQRVIFGSLIIPDGVTAPFVSWEKTDQEIAFGAGVRRPLYQVALASDVPPAGWPGSVLEYPVGESTTAQWGKEQEANYFCMELSRCRQALLQARRELADCRETMAARKRYGLQRMAAWLQRLAQRLRR